MPRRPPLTATIVVDLIDAKVSPSFPPNGRGAAPPCYFDGAKLCRNIPAPIIRESLALMRERRGATLEVRALAGAVREDEGDVVLVADWRSAIDGLRVLYHASPVGTKRQREMLLEVARNARLVAAMAAALRRGDDLHPTWAAVLVAEGLAESAIAIQPYLARGLGKGSRETRARWQAALQSYARSAPMRALLGLPAA
ncbi:MAG: hypothetical protein QM820_22310 [Minicystis sp.]